MPSAHDPADGRLQARGWRDLLPVRPASPADDERRVTRIPGKGQNTMAKDAHCPNCHRVSLTHTGAFWLCPRCGLMITKHALAEEIMRAGREDGPLGNHPTGDSVPQSVGD